MNNFLKDIFKEPLFWAVLLMGLILYLSSCEKPEPESDNLRMHTVREGRHDFTPSPFPLPLEAQVFEGKARFMPSCWYDNLEADQSDWNKLAGVYKWDDFQKNENSFILAWRPDIKIRDLFEPCLYENIQGENVPKESAIYKVKSGQTFEFELRESEGKYTLLVDGNLVGIQANDITYNVIGKISAWFGGNRTAPWDMHIYMNF